MGVFPHGGRPRADGPGMDRTGRAPTAPRAARAAAGILLASLVVAVGACAQSGGGPTQAQYAAAADSVCKKHETRLNLIEVEQIQEPDPARTERWIRRDLVPAYRDMSRSLRGIRPPDGDGVYLSGLYSDLDHVIALLFAKPSRGRALVRDDEDLRRRFSSYGMKVCGRV